MIKIALALGVLATAAATAAPAQYYYAPRHIDSNQECWNPGAGHFEQVRPGEYQGDLDYNRCRSIGYVENRYYNNDNYYDRRVWRESRQECWNPRARHYEEVRSGERQDDLDYSRCRIYR
jgi:hypothetical protein